MWHFAKPNCKSCGHRLIEVLNTILTTIRSVLLVTSLTTATAFAQDVPDSLGDFSFDSSSFGDDLFAAPEDNTPDWLQPFTFKLSQQIYGQTNSHNVQLADGTTRHKPAQLENNRFGLLTRYQNPFATGWLFQASAQAKLYWAGDYEHRANDRHIDTEFRLNEFFVQRSTASQSVKLGAQTVVWGENVGNSVLDVINTSEFRDLTIIDIEDARLNQWMLVWDKFGTNKHLSTFLNLYPEFNPPPVRGSPFFFEPAYNLTDYKRDEPLFEIGSRMRWTFTGSDIAIMAAYLQENQLRYEAPTNGIGDAVAKANDFLLLGFSANRAVGRLLLKLDISYSHDILADVLYLPLSPTVLPSVYARKTNQFGSSAGFEYAISNDQNISMGISAQSLSGADDRLRIGESFIGDEVSGNALVRYTNSLHNGDVLIAATVQKSLDASTLLMSLALNYTLSDNLSLMSQIISTHADDDSALAVLDDDVRAGLTLSWSF